MRIFVSRSAAILAFLMASAGVVSAQETGTIVGTVVTEDTRQPLSGVQVHIPNTSIGQFTNDEGRFVLLNVPAGEVTVRVQLMGYGEGQETVTLGSGGTVEVDFTLGTEAIAMEGLVVTALGIAREERSLGYASQSLGSEALEEAPKVNVTSSLQGRMAGVNVVQSSSQPGSSARITIRGETSFTGGGQPLWVVDGVPISVDTDDMPGFELNVGQAPSRALDMDPSSIEDISVLRGAAATALYGSRAASGAIIITTKKGSPDQATRFSAHIRSMFETPILAGKQTTYTQGREGYYCNARPEGHGGWCEEGFFDAGYTTPTTYWQWGPHKDSLPAEVLDHEGDVRMVDPRDDFYDAGQLIETNISASGGITGGGSYNLGVSHTDHAGISPKSALGRSSVNANVTLELTPRLQSTTTVLYSYSDSDWQNEGWTGRAQDLMLMKAPNSDVRQGYNPDGTPVMFDDWSPSYQWLADNEYYNGLTTRWIAAQNLRFEIMPNLTLSNRLGMDTYLDKRTQVQNERPWYTEAGYSSGGSRQERYSRTSFDNDLILNLSGVQLGSSLGASGLVGFNINARESDNVRGRGRDIVIPGYYNLENFERQDVYANLPTKRRQVGLYGQATFDYDDWAFLTLTGRNDWSSTLPTHNNNYFYPSAALGIVFTDALGLQSRWLDYGKLRLSYAKVGNDAPPYRLSTTYYGAGFGVDWPFRGQLAYMQSSRLGNPDLKPESTTEYEVGMELRVLGGRGRVDASYYDKKSYDQIFSVPSSPATGYGSITRNAGDLRNEGIELTVEAVPVQTSDFRWDLQVNWSQNRSKVQELAKGVNSIQVAGYWWPGIRLMEDMPYGVIWGYGYLRENSHKLMGDGSPNPDYETAAWDQGDILIDEDGYPLWDDEQKVIGSIEPDWRGSLSSSFRYGPFNVFGLFSMRQGGDMLKFDLNYTITNGSAGITEDRGNPYTYDGVTATWDAEEGRYVSTGERNDVTLTTGEEFWRDYGAYNHHENQIEDGSFVKLQEMTVSYDLPDALVSPLGVNRGSIYFTGYNLWISTDYSSGDVQGSNYGATNAGGAAYHFFLQPTVRQYSFGLRASF